MKAVQQMTALAARAALLYAVGSAHFRRLLPYFYEHDWATTLGAHAHELQFVRERYDTPHLPLLLNWHNDAEGTNYTVHASRLLMAHLAQADIQRPSLTRNSSLYHIACMLLSNNIHDWLDLSDIALLMLRRRARFPEQRLQVWHDMRDAAAVLLHPFPRQHARSWAHNDRVLQYTQGSQDYLVCVMALTSIQALDERDAAAILAQDYSFIEGHLDLFENDEAFSALRDSFRRYARAVRWFIGHEDTASQKGLTALREAYYALKACGISETQALATMAALPLLSLKREQNLRCELRSMCHFLGAEPVSTLSAYVASIAHNQYGMHAVTQMANHEVFYAFITDVMRHLISRQALTERRMFEYGLQIACDVWSQRSPMVFANVHVPVAILRRLQNIAADARYTELVKPALQHAAFAVESLKDHRRLVLSIAHHAREWAMEARDLAMLLAMAREAIHHKAPMFKHVSCESRVFNVFSHHPRALYCDLH